MLHREEELKRGRTCEAWKRNKWKVRQGRKRKTVADAIFRFQERDLHKLELKILDRQAKEKVKVEQKRLEKLQEKSEKMLVDPSRFYKTFTKGWKEWPKDVGSSSSGPLLHIPHGAIPICRQRDYRRIWDNELGTQLMRMLIFSYSGKHSDNYIL